jgi:CHASE3 domain sensor protein
MKLHIKHIALTTMIAGVLSGCGGEPEWVSVYEDCKQQIDAASAEMKEKTAAASEDNPQAKAMMDAMGNMAMAMGTAACETIKQTCEPDPDGTTCQTIVQEYKKDRDNR